MEQRTIDSIEALVDAEGSLTKAAALLRMSPQGLIGARNRGNLPARRMLDQRARLEERGYSAPVTLWSFVDPEAAA